MTGAGISPGSVASVASGAGAGVTIMGHHTIPNASPKVVGTRDATDVVLAALDADLSQDVLWLTQMLQEHEGVAF